MIIAKRILLVLWVAVAVLLRFYASQGGDASIVGGVLFLVWTAPIGMIWQFYIYDFALRWMSSDMAQMLGDGISIFFGAVLWFVFSPWLARIFRGWRNRSRNE
ncbi:hypothetical protein [Xanthomonas albilineans]|uniref:hypothetical protein n=1 Tax=Xanthomonas albilineans TaxID=29447 RepID=UPI000A5175D4|nr:hypothetical protein [Xanthomonas albilineans]